jgi:phosphatidylglycerol:prolipoprotein diacylglycerol transferase
MTPPMSFPQIDPVLVQIGPIAIRWYALAYIAGLLIGWRMMRRLVQRPPVVATAVQVDDFLTWAVLAVVLGGRLGYVLFYQPLAFLAQPFGIFRIWEGGMSFHGGMLGVALVTILFCRRHAIPLLGFADRLAAVAPVGLFFGRIANFINGELWGRVTTADVPWAMVFPGAGPLPRHPSQLYQAALEGLALFVVVSVLVRLDGVRSRAGMVTGTFLAGYAVARIIGELFREPDAFLGFLAYGTTMGQVLSLPMLVIGIWLILRARPPA